MLLNEITLGSRAHHQLVADVRNKTLSHGAFLARLKKSTMSAHDVKAIADVMLGIDMSKPVTRADLEQISAIANVSLVDLLDMANL